MKTILAGLACAVLFVTSARAASDQAPDRPTAAPQAAPASAAAGQGLLDLHKGDRIVLLGNTLAERMQLFNHFETFLMTRFPELELSVRNLGWSGDTITLQPRPLNFRDAASHLTEQKADVILAFFGLNESFDGQAGLPVFEKDLDAYLKTHLAKQYNGRTPPRLALVSPIAHEKLARLVHVDAAARNSMLAAYTDVMGRVAAQNAVAFVDLLTPTKRAMEAASAPLTINGIHLNEEGDRIVAGFLMSALGFSQLETRVADAAKAKQLDALREAIRDKNEQFFYRFRPVNGEYVVGRRVEPFGSVNFPPEMRELDKMVSERDRRIWKQARALQADRVHRSGQRAPESGPASGTIPGTDPGATPSTTTASRASR